MDRAEGTGRTGTGTGPWAVQSTGRLLRLDRVVVAVRELPASTGAFARLLGRAPSWRGERPAAGVASSVFALVNASLCLEAPIRADVPEGRRLAEQIAEQGEGPAALVFATDSAEACRRRLAAGSLRPEVVERVLDRDVESGAFAAWRRLALPRDRTRGVPISVVEPLSSPAEAEALRGGGADVAAVRGLDHVVIRTADPEASRRLYGEGLGLRLALDRRFEAWGVRLLFFRVGGTTVELAASLGEAGAGEGAEGEGGAGDGRAARNGAGEERGAPRCAPGRRADRLWGLSWQVGDARAARERIAGMGFDVSPVRAGRKPDTRVFTLRDAPAGVPTLMIEPRPRSGSEEKRRTMT